MDGSHGGSGGNWREVHLADGAAWIDTEFTAHPDTIALGFTRRLVYVTGDTIPSYDTVLSAARIILPPHTPVAILPGRTFGGPSHSRMAFETTDSDLAAMWVAAARAERR